MAENGSSWLRIESDDRQRMWFVLGFLAENAAMVLWPMGESYGKNTRFSAMETKRECSPMLLTKKRKHKLLRLLLNGDAPPRERSLKIGVSMEEIADGWRAPCCWKR